MNNYCPFQNLLLNVYDVVYDVIYDVICDAIYDVYVCLYFHLLNKKIFSVAFLMIFHNLSFYLPYEPSYHFVFLLN